jgi:hypothetical protein
LEVDLGLDVPSLQDRYADRIPCLKGERLSATTYYLSTARLRERVRSFAVWEHPEPNALRRSWDKRTRAWSIGHDEQTRRSSRQ